MAYLDDIIIYLNSEKEYKEYIKWVLKKLYKKIYQSQLRNINSILGRLIL
jgi:lysine/ornithine N-monooxygenase